MKAHSDYIIIDLSVPVDPQNWEPDPVKRKVIDHQKGGDLLGRSIMYIKGNSYVGRLKEWLKHKMGLGIDHRDFPDGKGLSLMTYTLTTHTGTHLDSPFHYGDADKYGKPMKTISEIPLEWCYGNGVVLDVSDPQRTDIVTLEEIMQSLSKIHYQLQPFDIVLLRTGGDRFAGKPRYFTDFRGISIEATQYLVENGIKVIGVDSFGFDAPFGKMVNEYQKCRDSNCLWPAHMYGRHQEYCHIERLANLDRLPWATGFQVACFPINLKAADAAWCRAVAILKK